MLQIEALPQMAWLKRSESPYREIWEKMIDGEEPNQDEMHSNSRYHAMEAEG